MRAITLLCAVGLSTVAHAQSSFEELKAQVAGLHDRGGSNEAASKLIAAWVNGQGVDRLTIDQAEWCLQNSLPNATGRRAFSVVWTGSLTPPRTGNYAFSVSPINVNQQFGRNAVRHSIVVSVADQRVVDVGPPQEEPRDQRRPPKPNESAAEPRDAWPWRGTPIELQAGQAVPIRVEMQYECSEPSEAVSPSAIVAWEGPGIGRQPIPIDVLTLPDGTAKGLQAEYSLQDGKGPPRTVSQTSPNVDYAWSTPADVAPASPALVAQLVDRLWKLSTAPEFLAECAAGRQEHPYLQSGRSLQYLSSDRRRELLQLITDNKVLLGQISDDQLLGLYRSLRFGAEDDAIDLLGAWMQLNADITPEITADFFRENRQAYAELAVHLALQQQDAYRLLQDRYLEMPDGRCALPVAYTLTYSIRALPPNLSRPNRESQGNLPWPKWRALIDARIDDPSATGDFQVNWLIAKAQSTESRGISLSNNILPHEDFTPGLNWLTEAHLCADSQDAKSRAYAEELSRLVAMNRQRQAREVLHSASEVAGPREMNLWRTAIEAIDQQRKAERLEDLQLSQAAYIDNIRRFREQAATRNDESDVQRYDQILRQAETTHK